MSDGPWKSLPLRRRWKQVAKRLENEAFSPQEVAERMNVALLREAGELPVEAVLRSVGSNGQGDLFGTDLTEKIDSLRQDHPGVKNVQNFLTYLNQQDTSASSGLEIVESALADTLDECLHDHARSIQEHYLGNARLPWERVEGRFDAARRAVDVRGLASRIVDDPGSPAPTRIPAKRDGLDEGPQL